MKALNNITFRTILIGSIHSQIVLSILCGQQTLHPVISRRTTLTHDKEKLTRLATANRSRVRIRGRSRRKFPHIWFDHHAKSGCCFSYCVHACRSQKFLGRCMGPHPREIVYYEKSADPLYTLLRHVCYHIIFGRFRSN